MGIGNFFKSLSSPEVRRVTRRTIKNGDFIIEIYTDIAPNIPVIFSDSGC